MNAAPSPLDAALAEALDIVLRKLPMTSAVYLFGSQARGDARRDSDIDLAVFTNGASLDTLSLWEARLDLAVCLGRPVDLVNLDDASTVLQREVVADGRRLYASDPRSADLFELRVLREYADLRLRRADLDADIAARGWVTHG